MKSLFLCFYKTTRSSSVLRLLLLSCFLFTTTQSQPLWQSNLDSKIQFYQTTDFGILLAGTNNSLYGIDGKTGQRLWKRSHRGLNETSITPVPGTDLVLFTLDQGKKSRLEAVDLLTGNPIWRSDKIKGDVLQLAVDPEQDLIAVIMVKNPRGSFGKTIRKKPITHVLRLSDGEELWKRKFVNDVVMMPSRFDKEGKIAYTLDNYRAPLMLDNRLFLFYEGVTSYDARTGKNKKREKFGVNEDGLALTNADPIFDDKYIYISGRGKVRAVDRRTGKIVWKAKDLGVTSEITLVGNILYVRTGGQFTRIKDGKIKKKGPFGVSAIDTRTGKRLWRYKGADKGMTNFVFPSRSAIFIADKNELIAIDTTNGKRIRKFKHKVKDPQFVLLNERNVLVVGGREELAAFGAVISTDIKKPRKVKSLGIAPLWRVKHKPPSRGIFRITAGIALRATAVYFRYGSLANTAFNAFRGASLAKSALSFRWSGLKTRFSSLNLTTLASNSAQNYVGRRIRVFGVAARTVGFSNRVRGLEIIPSRKRIIGGIARRNAPSRTVIRDSLIERLDPVRRLEKLSDFFLRRKRLSEFRGKYMYFYTDLPRPFRRKGLAGVNVHTGKDARFILIRNPDVRFITDETNGILYSANGKRLQAFEILR